MSIPEIKQEKPGLLVEAEGQESGESKPPTAEEINRELEARALAGDSEAIREILAQDKDFEH